MQTSVIERDQKIRHLEADVVNQRRLRAELETELRLKEDLFEEKGKTCNYIAIIKSSA